MVKTRTPCFPQLPLSLPYCFSLSPPAFLHSECCINMPQCHLFSMPMHMQGMKQNTPAALLCLSLRCPRRSLVPNRVVKRPMPMSGRLYRRRHIAAAQGESKNGNAMQDGDAIPCKMRGTTDVWTAQMENAGVCVTSMHTYQPARSTSPHPWEAAPWHGQSSPHPPRWAAGAAGYKF